MKVMSRRLASIVAVAVAAIAGSQQEAQAADACPSECRRQLEEVVCSAVQEYRDGRWVLVEVKFWSNGAY